MTLTKPYMPTAELVAITWLKANAPAYGASVDKIATALPRDTDTWFSTGFLTVRAIAGGQYDPNGTRRTSTVQVDAWWSPSTSESSSGKPPWGKANALIEAVVAATEKPVTGYSRQLPLVLPDYAPVVVLSAYPAYGEPMRVENDPAGFARYQLDLAIDWARA